MRNKIFHIIGLLACIGIAISCFLPWAHYNSINETFTGVNVKPFTTGNYYGRAGIVILVISGLIFLLMLLPRLWAKRVNLFLAAILIAYCIRTYIIFTSALFEGEVQKLPGIYLIILFAFIIMLSAVFPYEGKLPRDQRKIPA